MDTPTLPPQPAKSGSKTKIIVIVIAIVAIALLGYGCSRFANVFTQKGLEEAIERASGGKADINLEDGSFSVKTDEGTATWGGTLPSDWPSDVPTYPDAKIQASGSGTQNGLTGVAAVLLTSDTAEKIQEYYRRELAAKGWTISGQYQSNGTATMTAKKGDRDLGIAISSAGEQTSITIGVEQK